MSTSSEPQQQQLLQNNNSTSKPNGDIQQQQQQQQQQAVKPESPKYLAPSSSSSSTTTANHPYYQHLLRQQQQQQQQQFQNSPSPTVAVAATTTATSSPVIDDGIQSPTDKPRAGTDEWFKIRKANHKEVERRRRENINHGIKELAALIPNQDSNKLQTIRNAVEYIKRLKENEHNNIEKWTLEKLLTDQAVTELATSNEKLKQELEKLYREIEHWKKIANNN